MFNKILVPLDGSKLAECALAYAEELALNSKSEMLTLISVTERVGGKVNAPEAREIYQNSERAGISSPGGELSSQYVVAPLGGAITEVRGLDKSKDLEVSFGRMEKQAWNYLEKMAKPLRAKGIPVNVEVLIGSVADSITEYAKDKGFDIIIMSSHGRSGTSRWALGSVTDKVFRSSCIPVLMVRAPGCFPVI